MDDILDFNLSQQETLLHDDEILWEAEILDAVFNTFHPKKEFLLSALYAMVNGVVPIILASLLSKVMQSPYPLIIVIAILLIIIFFRRIKSYYLNEDGKTKSRRYFLTDKNIKLFDGSKWLSIPIDEIRDIGFTTQKGEIGSIVIVCDINNFSGRNLVTGERFYEPRMQALPDVRNQHEILKKKWKTALIHLKNSET